MEFYARSWVQNVPIQDVSRNLEGIFSFLVSDARATRVAIRLQMRISNYQYSALAPSTRRAYARAWHGWTSWSNSVQVNPWLHQNQSVHSAQLLRYAKHLYERKKHPNGAAAILSKISAIAWHHKATRNITIGLAPRDKLDADGMAGHESPMNGQSRLLQPCSAAITKLCDPTLDETTPFGAALSSPSFSACGPASTQVLPPKRSITSANKTCNSTTSRATLPAPSKKRNLSASSSEAARPTKRHGVAPDHSLDQATPSFARSSLRGACKILAGRSKLDPQIHCASTPPRATRDTMYLSPSSLTRFEEPQDAAAPTQECSRHTPSEAEEQLKCSSEEVPTQPSNYLDVGSRTHTSSTFALKPARTSASHLK